MLDATDINAIRTGPRGAAPVVLLHSAGLDLTYWDAQIEVLCRDHDVIALDLPGHGRSHGKAQDISIENMSEVMSAAIARLHTEGPVHLVGLSVGGLVAQAIALQHPRLLCSLVLIDTAASFSAAGRGAMRERAEAARRGGMDAVLPGLFAHWFMPETLVRRPHLVDRATKTLLHDDPDVHAALWEMIAAFDVADRLGAITVPTLVLVGEHDSSSPVSCAQHLCGMISHSRLRIVPGAAHLSPLESPDVVTGHIAAFLQEATG
ncbi:alpha/beta fold hydrolase [Nocardia alni]|uniref:alpha/beta fold hydrolase n=1 Tax=Nocardia alni TaxID=2815723 RepID=UPI001C221C93|nr:alpha/beta fold hydrolase [Nocardia alni]